MKPAGERSISPENASISDVLAGCCTPGCTETASRVEILARAVELVAAMRLPLEEASAVLETVTARLPAG
jgi:hypothetical protein